jgi:HEAT repeat protein
MMRVSVLASAIGVLVLLGPLAFGQAKKAKNTDPVVDGKTISEWTKALAGKELLPRIRAVNALMRAGPEARAAAPALIELFRDGDATFLHPLAAVTLSRMGEDAVPALQKALADKGAGVKSNAALTLGLIGSAARAAVPALTAALKDADAAVRQAAAQALGRVGSPARPAASRLYDLLGDRDVSVRIEAALALWRASGDTRGVKALAAALLDKDDAIAQRAIEGLGEIGIGAKDALGTLETALKSKSASRRVAIAEALYRVSGETKASLPTLLAELRAKDRADRRLAVAALGTLAADAEAVGLLTKLLDDADIDIRREAACALSERGTRLDKARPALEACLSHADAGVRWWAAVALAAAEGDIRKHEPEILRILRRAAYRLPEPPARGVLDVVAARRAVPALAAILKSRSGSLAIEAARSLASLGLDARDASAELLAALGSNDKMLSRQAAAALATMNVEVMPRLVRFLGNENTRLRAGAARSLGLIGLAARGHVGALTRLLKDGEAPVRTAAALALWNIDGNAEVALPPLNFVLKDFDAKDRWEAIEGIGVISVEARPPIRGLTEIVVNSLKDRDARVRMQAAKWLWRRTRQAKVVIPLIRDGVTDRDLLARLTAVETLGEMGTEDRVVGLLLSALEDRTPTVRLAAVEGLARSVPVKQLVALLADKTPRVRLAAVHALGLVSPPAKSAISALVALRQKGGEAASAIDQTLGELFPANADLVQELLVRLGQLEKADKEKREGILKEIKAIEKKLLATP